MLIEKDQGLQPNQSRFIQESLHYIRSKKLFTEGERVLVAVSGGLDSTVLLHALAKMSRLLGIYVEVAHVDHRTRGQSSEREGLWVKVLAERLHLKLHNLQIPVPTHGGQDALRQLRREALTELAEQCACTAIATAHHANDNAETFLMRSISGTGVAGLAGMKPRQGAWAKPLLWASRTELEQYARQHRLAWVEDPSNERSHYLRNYIRNLILPQLEEKREGSIKNLATAASRVQEEEAEWNEWLNQQLEGPRETLSLAWLERWPLALKRRVMRYWLTERLGVSAAPSLVEALLRGDEVIHPAGCFLRRSDMMVFSKEDDFSHQWHELRGLDFSKRVNLGQSMAWSFLPSSPARQTPLNLSIMAAFTRPGQRLNVGTLLFSWERTPWPLGVRRVTPEEARKSVDVFEAYRIPKPYRSKWPVIVNLEEPTEVIALLGLKVFSDYEAKTGERAVAMSHFYEDQLKH